MPTSPFYASWAFWFYFAAWLPYTTFVILYATRSPWYTTALGRSLLLSKTVIAVLITNVLLSLIFGDYAGRAAIRVFLIGGAIVAGWYQLAALLRLQRQSRRCPVSTHEEIP